MLSAKRFQKNFQYAMKAYAKHTGQTIGKAKMDFAQQIGKSYGAICTYCRGLAMPSLQNIETMAATLGLHVQDFLRIPETFSEVIAKSAFLPENEEDIRTILSSNLKLKMAEKNMTSSDIAKELGIKTPSAHALVHGKNIPSPETLDAICRLFSIEPYELLTPTEETQEIAKYDALRIDGAPPVKVTESGVRFTVECTRQQADKLLERSDQTQTAPNEIIIRALDGQ